MVGPRLEVRFHAKKANHQLGTDVTFSDNANVIRSDIEQIYGGFPSLDRCPLDEGVIIDVGDDG